MPGTESEVDLEFLQHQVRDLQRRVGALEGTALGYEMQEMFSDDDILLDPSVFIGSHDLSEGVERITELSNEEGVQFYLPATVQDMVEEDSLDEDHAFVQFFADHPGYAWSSWVQFIDYYEENRERFEFFEIPEGSVVSANREEFERRIRGAWNVSDTILEEYEGWEEVLSVILEELAFMAEMSTVAAFGKRAFSAMADVVQSTATWGKEHADWALSKAVGKQEPLTNTDRLKGLAKFTGTLVLGGEIPLFLGFPLPLGAPTVIGVLLLVDP